MNQAAFAARHGVSRTTATRWKTRGWLVLDGSGAVDVVASDANLERYRRERVTLSPPGGDRQALAEAQLSKEKSLAALRRLEHERRANAVIAREAAQSVFDLSFRAQRAHWRAFPAYAAPKLAHALGLDDVDRVTCLLARHIEQELAHQGAADFTCEP